MRKINLYSFHRNIHPARFDAHNTYNLVENLKTKYEVTWYEKDGEDNFHYINDCNVLINQGSILIFEFDDTKQFKTFDFGDTPSLTVQLSTSKNFIGASIGQYNSKLWDDIVKNNVVRKNIRPSIYPETYWNFGIENYEQLHNYRKNIDLDKRLYWRGSLYKDHPDEKYNGVRKSIEHIQKNLTDFYFGSHPISFDDYIQEAIHFKLALGFGGGGGYTCGDFCFRDIEMYGIGIPTIRPKFIAETIDPLIPNIHYISVDCEFDENFRYINHEKLAHDIINRYHEVKDDNEFLNEVVNNARNWYIRNISEQNITQKIIESLEL